MVLHQTELKMDLDPHIEFKTEETMGNEISSDLNKSLKLKYYEKFEKLNHVKALFLREKSTLNTLCDGKEATVLMLSKANDTVKEYDDEIEKLEQKLAELKEKRKDSVNEIDNQIMPKLNQQTKCIISKQNDVDALNKDTMKLETELTSIEETRGKVQKFDEDMRFIIDYLERTFKTDLR